MCRKDAEILVLNLALDKLTTEFYRVKVTHILCAGGGRGNKKKKSNFCNAVMFPDGHISTSFNTDHTNIYGPT
jgi:hypothetical protein